MSFIRMKSAVITMLIFLQLNQCSAEGFAIGTLVKTSDGYKKIEELYIGDWVICRNETDIVESIVTYVGKKTVFRYAKVWIGNKWVEAAVDQKIYRKNEDTWIDVGGLKSGDVLSGSDIIVELINEPVEVYLIGIAKYHNFFVTENEVCVHNFFPPIVLALSAAFGLGSIELTTISAGVAGLGAIFGYQWHKKIKEKHTIAIEQKFYSSGMMPEDPDDEKKSKRNEARNNFQPLTNQQARDQAKELGYRETKSHPCGYTYNRPVFTNGKEFISPDAYGHRGGVWKLFNKVGKRIATVSIDLTKVIGA